VSREIATIRAHELAVLPPQWRRQHAT
jgi:hypothetical protein